MAFRKNASQRSNGSSLGDFRPDLTLLFDVPVEVGTRAIGRRTAIGQIRAPAARILRARPHDVSGSRGGRAIALSRHRQHAATGRRARPSSPQSSPPCERIDVRRRPAAAQALLPWHRDLATAMLQQRARWPHALLIAGRRGLGKRALALHFARALLCEAPRPDGDACGVCPSCLYVAAGAHPDLRLIEPLLFDEEGNVTVVDAITVDRIRELTAFTQLSTHRHRAKVAVIAPAEAMNAAAANALLKTLEEPPADTYLMLVSHQSARLPATIISRCRRLPVPEPDVTAAAAWLAGARRRPTPIGCWRRPAGRLCWRSSSRIRRCSASAIACLPSLRGRSGCRRSRSAPASTPQRRTSARRCLLRRCTGC